MFHGISHNSVEVIKWGILRPRPQTYWIPRGFPMILEASFTPKCMEFTGMCGISWISHKFTKVCGNDEDSRFPVNFAFWSGGALQNHWDTIGFL